MELRKEIIRRISKRLTDDVVIASTGMICRELYEICDRPRNFYMMGSMGSALAIGLGLAYRRPDLRVIVISGDAAALMGLGSFVLHKKLNLNNLSHYILDNKCHATTGGQKTASEAVAFGSLAPNTYVIKVSPEKGDAPRIPLSCREIKERFENAIKD